MFILDDESEARNAWLKLGDVLDIETQDILFHHSEDFYNANPGFWEIACLTRPEYVGYAAWLFLNIKLAPYQQVIIYNLWKYQFPMLVGCRGGGKTFCLAVYLALRAILSHKIDSVIAAPAFRQAKMVFQYIERFYYNSPMFKSILTATSGPSHDHDKWTFRINDNNIYAIPMGTDGSKIRGLRAQIIACDEFGMQNPKVIEEVVSGFGAVRADPVERVIDEASKKYFENRGLDCVLPDTHRNQMIVSGSADYHFNHFYTYWKRYCNTIKSQGNPEKLAKVYPEGMPEHLNWQDFCVMRIPYGLLPKGYAEDSLIARSRSSMSRSIYLKEYEAIFVEDSDGFFKRSTIESCVASEKNVYHPTKPFPPWCKTIFEPMAYGNKEFSYVMGIDPASERDNLAICILELHENHSRLAQIWTTNRVNYIERQKRGLTRCENYYQFVCEKIRNLMKSFNIIRIGIDMGGGGIALVEGLHETKGSDGEEYPPIWDIKDPDNPQECDNYAGLHLIVPIHFSRGNWVSQANWGLLKDLENKTLIFPNFDNLSFALAASQDNSASLELGAENLMDSREDILMEIEELKNELASIVIKKTGNREKWIVPGVKDETGVIGTGKKDRYTALLIANAVARDVNRENVKQNDYPIFGGRGENFKPQGKNNPLYYGPDWFVNEISGW